MDTKVKCDVPIGDIMMILPNHFAICQEKEWLPQTSKTLIRNMAQLGYWPVDFGENYGEHIELWFSLAKNILIAKAQAEHFIKKGGYV